MPSAEPFALVEKGTHGLRISAVNAAARSLGVTIGTSLPDARAALPSLAVRPAEAAKDRQALKALAAWLDRYGPSANVDADDGAWVDVTGVPHLFGGEVAFCQDLARHLGRLGFTARIGLADTLGGAHALARFGSMPATAPWLIAPAGNVRAVLGNLPVSALRLEPEAVRLLVRLGLKHIDQLYGLPREALAARFRDVASRGTRKNADTAAVALLLRLDQALGILAEPRRPLRQPPEALSRLAFPEPLLTAEGVEEALNRLVDMLAKQLESQALGGRRFRLSLYRTDGTVARAAVGTSQPCRDPSHVCRLMAERLGNIDAGFGVDVATLEAGLLMPFSHRQIGLDETTEGAAALVDRLASRLGVSSVRVSTFEPSHIPERSETWWPVMGAAIEPPETADGNGFPRLTPPRPPFLLRPPEPISVIAELPEGAPQRFVWRRLARRIMRSEGPERIAPEWWRHIGAEGAFPGARDYYRLEDATGARYWVFREGLYPGVERNPEGDLDSEETFTPHWFVHGLFA